MPPCRMHIPSSASTFWLRSLSAKWNKGAGSHATAPMVLLSGPSATSLHRGILHSVNRPICTNCCENRPSSIPLLRSASRSIKAFSVLIDVGCFVLRFGAAEHERTCSDDFHHQIIPKPLVTRQHICSGLRGTKCVYLNPGELKRTLSSGTETVRWCKGFTILRTIMFPTAGGKERLQHKSSQLTELSLPIYEYALTWRWWVIPNKNWIQNITPITVQTV